MPRLTFDEINNWSHFEQLGIAYFRSSINTLGSNIVSVEVMPSGAGPDQGVDILVEFSCTDFIKVFKRKWVVQFKFHNTNISTSHISDINLPQLIYSHGACGYLLVCKKDPTSKLVTHFKDLNSNCKEKYFYEIWSGDSFISRLINAPDIIHKQFFPGYFDALKEESKKIGLK